MCTEEQSQSLLGAGIFFNLYFYKTGPRASGEEDAALLLLLLLLPGVDTADLGHVHLSSLF